MTSGTSIATEGGRRWALGFALLMLSLSALGRPWELRIDNSLDVWIRGAPGERHYREFVERFGSDRFLLASWYGDQILRRESLDAATRFYRRCRALPGVEGAAILGAPLLWERLRESLSAERFAELIEGDPALRDFLCAADGRGLGLMIPLSSQLGPSEAAHLSETLGRSLQTLGSELSCETALVGPSLLNAALDMGSARDARVLFPLLFLLSSVALLIYLRAELGAGMAILGSSALSVVCALSAYARWCGTLNMVTVTIPSLVWILSLSLNLHSLHRLRFSPRSQSLLSVLRPCILAGLTTAAGFAAVGLTGVGPVTLLGSFVCVGVLVSLLLSAWVLAPFCARGLPRATLTAGDAPARRNSRRIVWGGMAIALLALLPARQLRVESRVLDFLPKDHPIQRDYARTRDHLSGVSPLELDIRILPGGDRECALREIAGRTKSLEADPRVAKVFGLAEIRQLRSRWAPRFIAAGVASSSESLRGVRRLERRFDDPRSGRTRVMLLLRDVSSRSLEELRAKLRLLFPVRDEEAGFETEITGTIAVLSSAQEGLVKGTAKSLLLALGAAFASVLVLTRRWRWVAAVMLPLVAPPLAVVAGMGLFDIPLDVGTMMVASVSAGIGIDDTLHMLASYQEARRRWPAAAALASAEALSGRALVATTVVNVAGFSALSLASFRPIRWFGALTALALVAALLADLVFLPAALARFDRGPREAVA